MQSRAWVSPEPARKYFKRSKMMQPGQDGTFIYILCQCCSFSCKSDKSSDKGLCVFLVSQCILQTAVLIKHKRWVTFSVQRAIMQSCLSIGRTFTLLQKLKALREIMRFLDFWAGQRGLPWKQNEGQGCSNVKGHTVGGLHLSQLLSSSFSFLSPPTSSS